jgi:CBS domain containing-hemolysin-like protein
MIFLLVFIEVIIFVLLLGVTGVIPKFAGVSQFELTRRKNDGDKTAEAALERENLLTDVLSLQRVISALLLVLFVVMSVVTFGWLVGIATSLVVSLEYGRLAQIGLWRRRAQHLYEKHEPSILHFVQKFSGPLRLVRNVAPKQSDTRLSSREELTHLVETSGTLLSSDEKTLIIHSLKFNSRMVSEIMTPRGVIDSIGMGELLGPLVLDDLHKTGHSRFPVVDGDIDHVVGMLHIQDLLTLDKKRSLTAGKAMESRVFYIKEGQTLQHALAAFIRTHHHLFVVVNEYRETVGLLSLEDVIEALIGRKIVDEFDTHEDLRVVAARNLRENNQPRHQEDV